MKAGRLKITWSSIGKLVAGLAMVTLSFVVFKSAPGWVQIVVLAVLVLLLFAPHNLMRKKLPPEVEKALKGDDKKGGYG